MAISKTYATGIYVIEGGMYEVWHNGRYVARVSTPEEAENLKQIAKENSERGNPLAGVVAAREAHKVAKKEKAQAKARQKIAQRIEKYRQLNADDLNDLANWIAEVIEDTPQIFTRETTQKTLEEKVTQILNERK